ncbi:endonuclease/exonuclease/phosphatase family metal-dependent hydrolase [Ereboglobus sp. PH5-10]|uniref:endonuclease/exonuclease/phosphatase family protein n=1 Tax=Ereboglobus sp. PH5-10 TaxID=2940629 RepID=UPI002407457F|nr:endonuclease/exonuclease/phosphatase family protein [Ereboglobus sp. PH5-10]MDF9828127.1 endonuclease/exonuclease/phosphatase family metal-dependent hydrolase [Ereboglobus sp. PH5-10]
MRRPFSRCRLSGLFLALSPVRHLALLGAVILPFGLSAETLSVATYNTANYTLAGRFVDGVYTRGYPKPENEKQALRAVIKALDADIVALQEMGSQPFLEELRRDLKTEGVDYPHAIVLDAADEARHVAVLSRKPFTRVSKHTDLEFAYFDTTETVKRGLLEVRVKTAAGELALFIVHLKSRLTDRKDDPESTQRRAAEARAVRDRVFSVFPKSDAPGALFMILGDFNDSRSSPALRTLTREKRVEIMHLLRATDSRGEVWTHFYGRQDSYSRIDHMLVSPSLKRFVKDNAAQIHDGPGVRDASDHRPVIARFDFTQ